MWPIFYVFLWIYLTTYYFFDFHVFWFMINNRKKKRIHWTFRWNFVPSTKPKQRQSNSNKNEWNKMKNKSHSKNYKQKYKNIYWRSTNQKIKWQAQHFLILFFSFSFIFKLSFHYCSFLFRMEPLIIEPLICKILFSDTTPVAIHTIWFRSQK